MPVAMPSRPLLTPVTLNHRSRIRARVIAYDQWVALVGPSGWEVSYSGAVMALTSHVKETDESLVREKQSWQQAKRSDPDLRNPLEAKARKGHHGRGVWPRCC